MAEIFKFFNSAPGDERWHYASDFADYFANVLSSGLLHKDGTPNLQVKVNAGTMQTYVEAGEALIQGYQYQNTLPLFLTHGLPEPNLDRIDRIVLRLDKRNNARYIKLFVKEGVSAANPVAPTLQRDQYVFELSLAQIRLTKNTSTLEPLKLVDERMKEDVCGIVYSLISVPTSVFQQQWDYWFNNKKQTLEDDLVAWQVQQKNEFDVWESQMKTDFDEWKATQKQDFLTWFESIKDILEGDVAANLAARIANLEQEFTNHISTTAISAHKAKNIEVVDADNLFTAIDVEGVLKELFTNADSAQKGIANVVGSPAIPSNTLSQLKTHIQNAKNKGATNLTAKGQSSVGTESLDALMSKIANVNTGKKFASGTLYSSTAKENFYFANDATSMRDFYSVEIVLPFKPAIMQFVNNYSGSVSTTTYQHQSDGRAEDTTKIVNSWLNQTGNDTNNMRAKIITEQNDSFRVKIPVSAYNSAYSYQAFER